MTAGLSALMLGAGWPAWAGEPGPSTVELVVSPSGGGSACNARRPCGLSTARTRVRALSATMDVAVVFADGTYPLAGPLRFGEPDGGRNGHRVTYQAAPGAHPLLSGGMNVTGWSHDPVTGLWSAPVPAGTTGRELYVNGMRTPRTSEAPKGVWTQTSTGYITTDVSVLSWRNPANVELVFSQGNGFWTEPRCDVAAVAPVPGGAAVTVRQPCWSNLHIPDVPAVAAGPADANGDNAMGGFEGLPATSAPSAVENVFGLLTIPGHWYLDQAASRVYYLAPPGEDPNRASIVLPVRQRLIEGVGTLDEPVSNLTLEGLTFAYTTWLQPSGNDGFAEMQANMTLTGANASGSDPAAGRAPQGTCQYTSPRGTCPFAAWTKPPSAVTFRAAHNVTISRNRFLHLGAAGLGFAYGSQGNHIEGNEFTDISGSGIQLGNTNDPLPSFVGADDREINDGNTITNNWIQNVGAEYHGAVGIWVGYTRDTVIAHNQLDRLPYTAISVGWGGWHTDLLHPANPSIAGHNLIADNLIYDYLTTLPDGGAIYTNGTQGPADPAGPASDPFLTTFTSLEQMARGLTIRGNVALLATWSEFAYYNDEGGDYITYDTNVEYQAHAFAHGGCDTVGHILIAHSYWAQPTGGYICPPPPIDVNIVDYHIIPDHPGPADIPTDVLSNSGLQPTFRDLLTSQAPEVTGVGAGYAAAAGPVSAPVLISGSGFTPDTAVFFGPPGPATSAHDVKVLSANYLVATPPSGTGPGQLDVVVTTSAGPSAVNPSDQYVVAGGKPEPLISTVPSGLSRRVRSRAGNPNAST
ncbi:MAG: right-handed parallel beta-helix repeat-containing protein [Acidimicrobiales bacterium]